MSKVIPLERKSVVNPEDSRPIKRMGMIDGDDFDPKYRVLYWQYKAYRDRRNALEEDGYLFLPIPPSFYDYVTIREMYEEQEELWK